MRACMKIDTRPDANQAASSNWFYAAIIALLFMVCTVKHVGMVINPRSGEDFYHFWLIPRINHVDPSIDWYDRSEHTAIHLITDSLTKNLNSSRLEFWREQNQKHYATGLHPTGTPWFYISLGWIQVKDLETDFQLFQAISSILFFVGCIGICLKNYESVFWSLLIVSLFFLLHRGIDSDIAVSNVNRLQVGLVCILLFVMFPQRRTRSFTLMFFVASLATGALVAFKPNVLLIPLLLLMAFVLDRDYLRAWLHSSGIMVGGILAWYFGWSTTRDPAIWMHWKEYADLIWSDPFSIHDGNYAVLMIAGLHGTELKQLSTLLSLLILCISLFCIWQTRASIYYATRYIRIGLLGLVPLLITAPVTWGHYLVLAIPLSLLLVLDLLHRNPSRPAWSIGLTVFGVILSGLVPMAWFSNTNPLILLVSIQSGIVLLYGSGLQSLYLRPQTPIGA